MRGNDGRWYRSVPDKKHGIYRWVLDADAASEEEEKQKKQLNSEDDLWDANTVMMFHGWFASRPVNKIPSEYVGLFNELDESTRALYDVWLAMPAKKRYEILDRVSGS